MVRTPQRWNSCMNGTSLIANASFNYEAKNTYQIFVRMIDRNGVWTDGRLNIRVMNVPENPFLGYSASIRNDNGTVSLGGINIGGDSGTNVTVFISSATAWVG